MSHAHRSLFALLIGCLTTVLCPAQVDDAEAVKEKLFQAKKAYDVEVQKFKKSVQDLFDKREDLARTAGDKKGVDLAKAERIAFGKSGEAPASIPAAIRQQLTAAQKNLDKAYSAAIKEYTRLKMDQAAEAVEKEQQGFQVESAFLFGKRTYLVGLKHFDVKTHDGQFTNDGTVPASKYQISFNGLPAAHSIYLHVPTKGTSEISYRLDGKWTAFRATIGVPKIEENTGDPVSPLTFELLGDGKSLWKSEPVTKVEAFQLCEVKVEKLKTLTLRIHCPDKDNWGRTVWYEPILVE
jgi:NPCBM/NEW2 domain